MRIRFIICLLAVCLLVSLLYGPAPAYREYFTPEQRNQLERIQTILVDVITLTVKAMQTPLP